jgi:hypothetical protein
VPHGNPDRDEILSLPTASVIDDTAGASKSARRDAPKERNSWSFPAGSLAAIDVISLVQNFSAVVLL